MCLGGKPKQVVDNSAEIARQQEEQRQADIRAAQGNVDSTFSKSFSPDFYSGVQQNYVDFYNPQLDRQYEDAVKQLTYTLARSGNDASSSGNDRTKRLYETYDTKKQEIANNAIAASNNARANVENQRSNLYSLASSSADPSVVASRANAAATDLTVPATYSPLGQVFAGLINQGANLNNISNAQGGSNQKIPGFDTDLNKSSGKII